MATPYPVLLHNPQSHPELCPNCPLRRLLCAPTAHPSLLPWNRMIKYTRRQEVS